jgi:hypothetical protein
MRFAAFRRKIFPQAEMSNIEQGMMNDERQREAPPGTAVVQDSSFDVRHSIFAEEWSCLIQP